MTDCEGIQEFSLQVLLKRQSCGLITQLKYHHMAKAEVLKDSLIYQRKV